jgi:hypothetical protein
MHRREREDRSMRITTGLVLFSVLAALPASAQTTDVVVGVPVQNGHAGKPVPGVVIDPDTRPAERVPVPVLIQEGQAAGGTTSVRPQFGGGYAVESPGKTTVVKPRFGGGYAIEENGRTTTEVKPNFGGGYTVESTQDSPTLILPPPQR